MLMGEKCVHVDLGRCEGHGKCYMVAGELFDFEDDHGRAKYIGGPITEEDTEKWEQAQRAISSCPEEALSLIDHAESGES